MYLPDFLFYDPKTIKIEHTTQYTGHLDVPPALEGNPRCWLKQDIGSTKQKKTLVISDFTLAHASEWDAFFVKPTIEKLLAEGFTIYLSQDQGPIKITEENAGLLALESIRKRCTPIHPQELIKQMAGKKVSSEAMEIVNLETLLDLEEAIESHTKISKNPLNVVSLHHLERTSFSIDVIKQAIPNLKVTTSYHSTIAQELQAKRALLSDPITVEYRTFVLTNADELPILFNNATEINNLFVSIDVSLKSILDTCKNITMLSVSNLCQFDVMPDSGPYPSIEALSFTDLCDKSDDKIVNLIKSMPNLKKIYISDMNQINQIASLLKENSEQITLDINQITITSIADYENLLTIIKSLDSTNIKWSTIHFMPGISSMACELSEITSLLENVQITNLECPDGIVASSTPVNPEPIIFTSLKNANLGSTTSRAVYNEIISRSPNLETLSLPINYLEKHKESTLKKLYKLGLAISTDKIQENIQALHQFAPNLCSLTLQLRSPESSQSAEELSIAYDSTGTSLYNLRELRISNETGQSVDASQLRSLFKAAPHLTFIQFTGATQFTTELLEYLPNLEYLHLADTDPVPLDDILNDLKDLEEFHVSYTGTSRNYILEHEFTEKLKFKKLSLGSIDNVGLLMILRASPELLELSLQGAKNLDFVFSELAKYNITLPHLKKLDLWSSDLTMEGYAHLSKVAPNLKTLNVSSTPCADDLVWCEKDKHLFAGYQKEHAITVEAYSNQTLHSSLPGGGEETTITGTNSQAKMQEMDCDTTYHDITFETTKIFSNIHGEPSPPVNYYRNSIFNKLDFTADQSKPFCFSNDGDLNLQTYETFVYGQSQLDQLLQKAKNNYEIVYLGQHRLTLTENLTALPSLSPHEVLTALDIKGVNRNEIEIHYSARDNLYYIRLKKPGIKSVNLEFLVDVPPSPTVRQTELQQLAKHFDDFNAGALDLGDHPETLTGEDLARKIYEQRVGACRHRAVAFMHIAKQKFPDLPVRIITNDCHAFVEVKEDNQWKRCDLGGYPATLNVKEPVLAKEEYKKEIARIAPISAQDHPILSPQEFLDHKHITWATPSTPPLGADALALKALSSYELDAITKSTHGQNVLIKCTNNDDVLAMNLHLQYLAKSLKRPVFVIDRPEQISCASRWLKREKDDTGTRMPGPGGPLYEFLSQSFLPDQKPVLIVNWNNFSADELVRFNSLIDAERQADGTPLPKELVVVGLYNTAKANAYTGSDFYSRNPIKLELTDKQIVDHPRFNLDIREEKKPAESLDIELYHSLHWKEILLGRWTIDAGKIIFVEGPLVDALKKGKIVHLRNAPWHLPAFRQFWQEAKIHGQIPTTGEPLIIPTDFWNTWSHSQGYEWQPLITDIQFAVDPQQLQRPFALNPSTFTQFVPHYDIHQDQPQAALSLFSQFKDQTVDFLLTQPLSIESWHQLLKEAKKYQVKLRFGIPKDMAMPPSLEKVIPITRLKNVTYTNEHVELIDSTDISFTLQKLKKEMSDQNPLVIDISEMDNADIFYTVTSKVEQEKQIFQERISQVWKALQKPQTVILKGKFNQDLINACMSICTQGGLIINGKFEPCQGKLILLSNSPLSTAIDSKHESPSLKDKLSWIIENNPGLTITTRQAIQQHKWPNNITLAQLQASINHYLHSNPPSFNAHESLYTLPPSDERIHYDLSPETVDQVCQKFINERLAAITKILSYAPFVFVGGQTGVGKSTFIQRYLTPDRGFALYNEMTSLSAWAKDKTPNRQKILFLDEANIANNDYTLFEGLYEIPPKLLINSEIVELTPDHKVILAGNPMSYGGERHLPTLLEQHGNACTFKPIPLEYIYKEIIKPIFAAAGLNENEIEIYSRCILDVYQYVCARSSDEIYITPRELKLMAMMIVASTEREQDYQNILHDVAIQCLPKPLTVIFRNWFSSRFPPLSSLPPTLPSAAPLTGKAFTLTESRLPIYQSLQRLLAVRDKMLSTPHKVLQSSGLGGMLLEGEPGTGKSHFLIDTLLKQGYAKLPLTTPERLDPKISAKGFYVIPASLPFLEKKRILLQAFNQGIPVVIDEINSGPMLEQLINALLMGENPETKKPPERPGFLLFATQNPITMAGREATSRATARRLLFFEFIAYPPSEMKSILSQAFPILSAKSIDKQIHHHLAAVAYAKHHHYEPIPVFRDLYSIMEKKFQTRERKIAAIKTDVVTSKSHQQLVYDQLRDVLDKLNTRSIPMPSDELHESKKEIRIQRELIDKENKNPSEIVKVDPIKPRGTL